MRYKLFLDDIRLPADCVIYMHKRIGAKNPIYLEKDWIVVRNYNEFFNILKERGLPYFISFDHDLGSCYDPDEDFESYDEEPEYLSGYDCAQALLTFCIAYKQPVPEYAVHSSNPVGTENIISLLENYKKHE